MRCADCDALCMVREPKPEQRWTWARQYDVYEPRLWGPWRHVLHWEADHDVPLWNGGAHDVANLRVRCGPCHKGKTRREATERAALRRPAVQVPRAPQLALDVA